MKRYAIEAEIAVEADVEAAFDWYEGEESRLGFEFLEELRAAYHRILDHPFGYQDLRFEIRRVLTHGFRFGRLFLGRRRAVVIVAVLSTARDPTEWQRRI